MPCTVGQGLAEHPQAGLRMPMVGGAAIPSRRCRGTSLGKVTLEQRWQGGQGPSGDLPLEDLSGPRDSQRQGPEAGMQEQEPRRAESLVSEC